MTLEWMAWTLPTAIFFACIFVLLLGMGVFHAIKPGVERRGFLPIATTRGDRLFIGLLSGAYIHLFWIAVTSASLWGALAITVLWILLLLRWG
jgi:predicted small integral membrane protein